MLQCLNCPYNTENKYNFKRHSLSKHQKIINNKDLDVQNLNIDVQNLNNNVPNLNIDVPNLNNNVPNVDNQCQICYKTYSSKSTLIRHIKTCSGINNKECKFCQKILASKQSKDKHELVCKDKGKNITIINNTTINNTTINDNSVTNNNTTIINLNLNKNDTTPFFTDHITDKKIIDFFKESGNHPDLLCSLFINAIWAEKRNRCMIKTNMKNNFLQVLGIENKWVNMLDKIAISKYFVDVCHTGTNLIDQHTDMIRKKIKQEYIDSKSEYLKDMKICDIDNKDDNYKLLQLNAYNNSK